MTVTPGPEGAGPSGADEVYAALSASIAPDRTIDLAAQARARPALAGLLPALATLHRDTVFPLTGALVTPPADGVVRFEADGEFGLPGAAQSNTVRVRARLEYSAPDGRDRFELALAVTTAGWTFSTTFPQLPGTYFAGPGPMVTLQSSFLAGLRLDEPVFTAAATAGAAAAARLSGRLQAAPALAPFEGFFGAFPKPVDGTVVLPDAAAEPPELDLVAASDRVPIEVGPVQFGHFGLGLRSRTGLDPEDEGAAALSSLDGRAELRLGGPGPAAGLAVVPLLSAGQAWWFQAVFGDDAPDLGAGLAAAAALIGVQADFLSVVPGLSAIAGFRILQMEAGLVPPGAAGGPALQHVAATFASDQEWSPPVPFLRIKDVGMRWLAGWDDGLTPQYAAGTFFGTVEVGADRLRGALPPAPAEPGSAEPTAPLFSLAVKASFPSWAVSGELVEDEIPLDTALLYFLGVAGPDSRLKLTRLLLEGDPDSQTLSASAHITTDYTVPLLGDIALELTEVRLRIAAEQSGITGGLEATFMFTGAGPPGLPDPRFYLGADYTGADEGGEGWVFTGGLYPDSQVELVRLLAGFAGREPPAWAPELALEALSLRFATGSGSYAFSGRVAGRWHPELFGTPLKITAEASAEVSRASATDPVAARLSGAFAVGRLALTAALVLAADEATYEFRVQFGEGWLAAVTAWRGEEGDEGRHRVITLQLGGDTVGSIIEYLAALAAPTLSFRLEPPWDLLGRIELSRFLVTIDPQDGSVELIYRADAVLPMMTIETLGVRMERQDGRPSVSLILTGDFLGHAYPQQRPLSWDVLSQSPPALPGQGSQLLDLRYLGIGQRIALRGEPPATVREAVDRLARDMQAPPPGVSPLRTPAGAAMRYAADAEWLIGVDATVAEVLDLGIVFNDPRLYGLSVGLRGERAGGLAGLAFEILYKKVSDDVGVFRVELRLPDAFRRIELGAVAITLGIVVIEIYTDGSFLVDLGFPYEQDFSRSFSVEAAPFLGRGGLYFGVLDSAAGTRVPEVTNGAFGPVIALGVGLAAGVGKEVRSGPLSGGAYVELIAVFEGVFGWFTPAGSGTPSAQYHWVQATVAVHGKVYGAVDFAILQVSVTIEAWASVSVVLEAFRATLVSVSASVEVNASLQILFIHLSFSFTARIDLSFTIGTDQPAPWILAAGSGGSAAVRSRRSALPPPARRPEVQARLLYAVHRAALTVGAETDGQARPLLNWDPKLKVFPDAPRTADLTLLPVFSASGIPVVWGAADADASGPADAAVPAPQAPVYRIAFCLFAPDGGDPAEPSPAHRRTASAALSSRARTARELPAQEFIEALLRWSIAAASGSPGGPGAFVAAGQLALLAEELARPETAAGPFGLADLTDFFTENLNLEISGEPGGPTPATLGGTAVPMPPFLNWVSPQAGECDFATHNKVGPLYSAGAAARAARFSPLYPAAPAEQPPDVPADYESLAAHLFRDWCLMIAKTAVQAAADAMAAWPVEITARTSLADVAAQFPSAVIDYSVRAGDTLDSVAAAIGASPEDLAFLNPDLARTLAAAQAGAVIQVRLGTSPEIVAAGAADVPLAGIELRLGTVDHQVAADDTLEAIAARFGLPNAAALFADPARALAADPRLLRPGAVFDTPPQNRPWDGTPLLAAAVYFTHYYTPADIENAPWYAQAVFDLNARLIEGGAGATIPAGTPLRVPRAPYSGDTDPYPAVAGDTVNLIGTALALAHGYAAGGGGPEGWPAFRDAARPVPGGVSLPAARIGILPGETADRLALRTVAHAGSVPGLLGWIGRVPVLAPLFPLPVPDARITVATGETLAGLAPRTGLAPADLGRRIAQAQIFAGSPAQPLRLTVAHLLIQDTDTLVGAVLDDAALDVAGNSARQLLSGLRLPTPVTGPDGHCTATGPIEALPTLTGQMADGPAPDPNRPNDTAFALTMRVNPGTGWITLAGSTVAEPGDAGGMAALPPELVPYNPAAAGDPARLRPGMILRTGAVEELRFSYTNARLLANYPAAQLNVVRESGPAPLPTADTVPVTYGLSRKILLQTPVRLPIPAAPAPLTGNVTCWPFPESLLARARAGAATRYELVRAGRHGTGEPADTVLDATFATLLGFGVRRIGDRPHVYELLAAGPADRALALALYRYLTAPGTVPGTAAFLAAQPAPDAADTAGRAVLDADPAATFLLRTNQSTQSVPPGARDAETAQAGLDSGYAALADLAGFCMLLWQGSVTSGVGCQLGFTTRNGGDLPLGLFDEHGAARLSLLVVPAEQQRPAPAGRALLPVNTCALAGPSLDPATAALFAQDADGAETTLEPALPPGAAGYRLHLYDPGAADTSQDRTRRLFSLVTSEVPAGGGTDGRFTVPQSGLPAGPQADDGLHLALWQREQRARRLRAGLAVPGVSPDAAAAPVPLWRYEHALPITRFGPGSPVPALPGLPLPGLPLPDADPYRGITGAAAPVAGVQLGFADVLGNLTAPPSGPQPGLVPAPVGYTDALLGVSAWPATTLSYAVQPPSAPGADIRLAVTLAPQPAATAPGADPEEARAAAARQAERYAQAYYQLADGRAAALILSTLRQRADGTPEPLAADAEPLWRFAAAAYAAALAAAAVRPVTAGGTVAELERSYGIGLEELARANAARPLRLVFGETAAPAVPAYAVFAAGDTADRIAATTRPGWPRPADGAALLALSPNLSVLPLRAGAALTTPGRIVEAAGPAPCALAALAGAAYTTAGLLAEDNATLTGILAPGFVFEAEGERVAVPAEGDFSFEALRTAFAALGVTASVAALATESATRPGMILAGARLTSKRYLAGADETLAGNRSTFQGGALAAVNGDCPDLFDAGALVHLGLFGPERPAPAPGDTLATYADRFGCPPALLLAANADVQLPADALVIPGTVILPGGADRPRVPYTIVDGDTLDSIAGRFATTALELGEANDAMPGTLALGRTVSVTVDGTTASTVTAAGDSLDSVLARLVAHSPRITLADLVAVLRGASGSLAAGALLLCPPAVLPGAVGARLTPDAAAAAYHLDAAMVAEANLGTLGLIAPDVCLTDPLGRAEITTRLKDTFNSLASRFARADAAIGVADLIAANHDEPFLLAGAALLLPPAPVTVAASLGPGLGTFAAPVFALATTLRLTRPGGLVDPAFRAPAGDRPAQLADAAVPAPAEAQGRSGAATLTLAAFAAAFHAAFPDLRLGTARADAESGGGRAADLWVVDFRKEKGIAQVAAGPPVPMPDGTRAPRYFALRPLYPGPVTRLGVDVRALLPDGSLSPGTTPVDFQGLDTEVLARRLIADVDLFLGAGYAPGVYADPAARGALGLVLAAKRVLSAAIARGLDPVLTAEDQYMQAGKAEAVAALRQELAADLSRAYDTAVVVQYAATVDSPWTRGAALPPARLYGTAQPVSGTGGAQALPYTLSAARTVLDRPLSSVTFLMRVPDPGYHGAIPIDLDYNLLDLQFGIRPVTGAPGFEDSSWLAFYPPLAGLAKPAAVQTRLGAARVPVPLRAYPAPPSLIGQSARPTAAGPRPSVAETRLWTYSLTYSHEHAEQDEVLVTARFNVPPERSAASAPPDDVAVALMRYNTVADGLWELLAYYAGAAGVPAETAARAAGSFANLVSGVAEQWTRHWPAAADLEQQQTDSEPVVGAGTGADTRTDTSAGTDTGSGTDAPPREPVPSRYDFRVRVGYATDPAGVVLLDTVTLSGFGSGPVDPAIWPAVSCRAPDGRDILLEPQAPVGVSRTYRVPAADRIPAGEPPVLTLGWAGLPVARYQNARAELSVRRNQELLGAGGPATRDAFVFRTALTQAPAPVTPTLSWAEPIDISELGGTLAAALASAFTQLSLPSAGLVAAVSLSFGRSPVGSADPAQELIVRVPVTLAPGVFLNSGGASLIAGEADRWKAATAPPAAPGQSWTLTVTIASEVDPASPRPLLSLSRMVYRIQP